MIKRIIYRIYKVFMLIKLSLRKDVHINHTVTINRHTQLEGKNKLYRRVNVSGAQVGLGTYISENSTFRNVKIGRFCSIGQNVICGMGLHPTEGFVSTHPAFFSLKKQAGFTFVSEQLFEEHKYVDNSKFVVEIGNDVWIGNNALIMDGIKVGDGAVIAAGAIVTKDVEAYSIVGGVPAKVLKMRFEASVVDVLIKRKWWNDSDLSLKANSFSGINFWDGI